jgi:hypothetical protein
MACLSQRGNVTYALQRSGNALSIAPVIYGGACRDVGPPFRRPARGHLPIRVDSTSSASLSVCAVAITPSSINSRLPSTSMCATLWTTLASSRRTITLLLVIPKPVIRRSRETGERELVMMRWGIVPWFAKTEDEFKALSTINAKSDNLTSSKMWREPFAKRRCLVPASGLYEWPKPGHAISPTYEPESEPSTEDAGPGDLFGMSPKPARKKNPPKPIKRVFAMRARLIESERV